MLKQNFQRYTWSQLGTERHVPEINSGLKAAFNLWQLYSAQTLKNRMVLGKTKHGQSEKRIPEINSGLKAPLITHALASRTRALRR